MTDAVNPFVRLFRAEEADKAAPPRDTVSDQIKSPAMRAIEAPPPLPEINRYGPDRVRGAPPPNGTISDPTGGDDVQWRRGQFFDKWRRAFDNGGYVNSGGAPELTPGLPQRPDTWGELGGKLMSRLFPTFKQSVGGALDAVTEKGPGIVAGVADSSVGKGLIGAILGNDYGGRATPGSIIDGYERYMARERDEGRTPGAMLYNSAAADLKANEYSTGNAGLKRFAPMAAESAVQMLPAIAATLATKNPEIGMTIMGGQVFGQQYGDSRTQGRNPDQALGDAAFMAAAEVIGEEIPLGMMMKPGGKFLPRTLKQMGAEGVQEMFTQILQTGYDAKVLNPNMTWGEALGQIRDAGLVGVVLGGQMSVLGKGAELIRRKGETEAVPAPPGIIETAGDPTSYVTPEDQSSPIPTEMIASGKALVARGAAKGQADTMLEGAGVPKTGTRVSVTVAGKVHSGVVADAFDADGAPGVKIKLDDGSTIEEPVAALANAGVTLKLLSTDPADAPGADPADLTADQLVTAAQPQLLKPSDTPAPLTAPTRPAPKKAPAPISGFMAKVGRAESPSDTAKNPRSSAQGRYQFVDDTWVGYYKKVYGETGESRAQILAKKTDGQTQDRLMAALTADNDVVLKRAGVARTDGNRYLAHFAGAERAAAIVNADPNTPIEQLLSAKAIAANPFLKGKTAGQVVAWAAARMGDRVAAPGEALDPADDRIQFTDLFGEDAAPAAAEPAKPVVPERDTSETPLSVPVDTATPASIKQPAAPEIDLPKPTPSPSPSASNSSIGDVSIEPMPSGKSIVIRGATPDQLDAIRAALPAGVRPIANATAKGVIVANRYEAQVREALTKPIAAVPSIEGGKIDKEWSSFSPDSGTLGVPRADMPQIRGEHRGAMVNFFNARGIDHAEDAVPATSLKPTQQEFSPAKVAKAREHQGGDRAILVSQDGHVLDGHHQWMAKRDADEHVRVIRLKAPVRALLDHAREFPSASVDAGARAPAKVEADRPEAKQAEPAPKTKTDDPNAGVSPLVPGETSAGAGSAPAPAALSDDETANRDKPAPKEQAEGREPVYAEGDNGKQIGWLDPKTGRVERLTKATAKEETAPAEPAAANDDAVAPDKPAQGSLFSRTEGPREPVISLTGEEMGKLPADPALRIKIMRDRAIDWYRKNASGKTVTGTDGVEVIMSRAGMRKSVAGKGEDLLRAIPAIPAILEHGTMREMPHRRDFMTGYLYTAPIELDGRRLDLAVIAREDSEGRRQYDLTFDTGKRSVGSPAEAVGAIADNPGIEASPDADLNLRLADDYFNDVAADEQFEAGRNWSDVEARLTDRLKELGIADRIRVRVTDQLFGDPKIAGSYWNGLAEIALNAAQDPAATLNHEAIHALRDIGAFLPDEWRALERAARADKAMMESVQRRYPSLDDEAQVEEAVADRFVRHVQGQRESIGFVRRVFERVRDLLGAIGEALRGNGFTTAASVMRAIDSGDIGRRGLTAEPANAAPRFATVPDADGIPGPMAREPQADEDSRQPPTASAALMEGDGGRPAGPSDLSRTDRFRTALQDRMLPVLRVQTAIETALGRPLEESENPYLGEELMTGRIGAQVERLSTDMVDPLFDAMRGAGIKPEQLENYLYARHAPERNAHIASINEAFADGGGSGMTDAEAAQIVAEVERSGQRAEYDALAARVDAILSFAVDTRVEAGLLSQADALLWRNQYQHYVPLRGKAELDPALGNVGGGSPRQSGISVKGKESKRALGRASRAENILAYSVMQAEEAIARAETNRVGQQFHALAQASPDPTFWKIDKVERRAVWSEAKGRVEYQSQSRISAEDAPYTVSLKIDGVEHRVTLDRTNPVAARVADSMRNLTTQRFEAITKYLGAFTRFFSRINTSLNPEFVLTNAFRDLQTAGVVLQQHDAKGLVSGTLRDWRKALTAPTNGEGEWGRWRREFELSGGKVYFTDRGDLRSVQARLERLAAKGDGVSIKSALRGTLEVIDRVNDRVENAVRLAAFKNAREGGMSRAAAASVARNVTVNFTRKGTYGSVVNAGYAFYNASVQGSATLLLAAKRSKKVRAALAATFMLGFALDMLNRWASDDDDDGQTYWSKIPDFEKERNLIVMLPGQQGRYVKIPLGLGLNAFFSTGRNLSEMLHGRSAAAAGGEAVATALDAFNPMGSGSLLTTLLPTALDPIAEVATNRDFAGKPIQPEDNQYGPDKPPSEKHFAGASSVSKAVARSLNRFTGGTEVERGAISVSPELLDYTTAYFTGGVGRFVQNMSGLATAPFDPDRDVGIADIPFARKVVGGKPQWLDKSLMWDRLGQIDQAVFNAKQYGARGEADKERDYIDRNRSVIGLQGAAKSAHKLLTAIKKDRAKWEGALDKSEVSADDYRVAKKALDEREAQVVSAFNKRWNASLAASAATPR